MKRHRGFSLVEIAVVVAIALVLLSLGLTAINAQLSSASYSITKKRQDAIKDALVSYLGARKSLPCPYVAGAGTPVAGTAPPQVVGPPVACPQVFGVVPYAALGLAREMAEDGWGNLFSYQVYTEAIPACPGIGVDWANSTCFGAGKGGGLTVNDGTVAAPTSVATNVVAVVISHGANGLGAWVAAQGTRNVSPVTCEELQNAVGMTSASCTFVPNVLYKGESQANDDIVAYLTASDALQPLSKQGAINTATAQVNIDLQALYDQALGTKLAGITMSGSPPAPSGCGTPLAGLPTMYDPWGKPYVVAEDGAAGNFPICMCSGNSAFITSSATTCTIVTNPVGVTPICKSIAKTAFNSYIAKAGFSGCP